MNILLNIIWIIFGGLIIAIEYAISSVLLMITIIGIPFGLQTMKLAVMSLWPFGSQIADNRWPSGCLAGLMNVIWWFVGDFKLMKLALFPFGTSVTR